MKREEGRGKREEGRGKREEGRGKREEGRGKREGIALLSRYRSARVNNFLRHATFSSPDSSCGVCAI